MNTAANITHITKRDGTLKPFRIEKIAAAVLKAFQATGEGDAIVAERVAGSVLGKIIARHPLNHVENQTPELLSDEQKDYPTVEQIQDMVEETLMEMDYFNTAKNYILYRNERTKARRPDIFRRRVTLKPFEYPELHHYAEAVRHSYWVHTEFNFTSDIQDYKAGINKAERTAIKNSMLAIAQIEVAVKTFWGDLYKKMPKAEIGAVGFTFAESEVRHMEAYSHLIEILGLNHEFEELNKVPVIQKRLNYLEKVIVMSKTEENSKYTEAILMFSLFIEHVSLFSQFLIMMSFNKHKNLFKGISNVVEATSKEEQIHGLFGTDIINVIRDEHPEWFTNTQKERIIALCKEAYEAEAEIVDWIFSDGELEFMSADVVKEFIKHRLNKALVGIKMEPVFSVKESLREQTDWFDLEVIATKHVDFFNKRSVNYTKKSMAVTSDDLF